MSEGEAASAGPDTADASASTHTTGEDDASSSTTTAATSTTGEDETTAAATTTSCTFLCMPDGGPVNTFECDVWDQDCPEGHKCTWYANDGGGAWNSTKCVAVAADPADIGEPCVVIESGVSGLDDCAKGAMCWNVDPETNTGTCVALCFGNVAICTLDPTLCCPSSYASCTISSGGLALCFVTCDPLIQNCEGNGQVCYPVGNSFQCAPDVSGEMGAIGDPCEYINVCDPMTFCGNPAAYPGCDQQAGGCCIPFCDLGAPLCAEGTECAPWYDPRDVPPAYKHLGACVIPQ